jgi:hypothetical protein
MKMIYGLCVIGVLLIAVGSYLLRQEMQKNAELSQKNDTLAESLRAATLAHARREAALVSLAQRNAATARKTASAGASLAKNLAAAQSWADSPVPESVQRDLAP